VFVFVLILVCCCCVDRVDAAAPAVGIGAVGDHEGVFVFMGDFN